MYWKNYMISYSGKDSSSYITKLKYEWNSVSREQLVDDLTHMRVASQIRLEPGYFDNYEKYLSWDKKFYNIPDYICKQTIYEWNETQKKLILTPEDKKKIDEHYKNPLTITYLKDFEFKITRIELLEMISFHNEMRRDIYNLPPYEISTYKNLLDNFHYKCD